jgi:hypothetical protein
MVGVVSLTVVISLPMKMKTHGLPRHCLGSVAAHSPSSVTISVMMTEVQGKNSKDMPNTQTIASSMRPCSDPMMVPVAI